MATQALTYLLETVFNLFVLAVLTRFYAQAFGRRFAIYRQFRRCID